MTLRLGVLRNFHHDTTNSMREASNVRRPTKKEVTRVDKRPRVFSEEDKLAALQLGAEIGVSVACRELGISRRSFYKFVHDLPVKWSELQKSRSARLDELADRYAAAENDAIDRAEQILPKADAKEVAALIKAMGSSRGAAAANARQGRGDPDKSVELNVNFPQLEAAAEKILALAPPPPAIEATYEEDEDGTPEHRTS
jgi:transposase-like protein